jgi:hypothetical protein
LFTMPNAGASTDFWLRLTTVRPTADPHKQWLVLDNGAKYTLGLWRSVPIFSARRDASSRVCARLVGGLFWSTTKRPRSANRVALGVQWWEWRCMMTRSLHIPHSSSRIAAQERQGNGAYSVAYRIAPPFPVSAGAGWRSNKVGSDQTIHL